MLQPIELGWECSNMQNNGGQKTWGPTPVAWSLVGYQFSVGMHAPSIPFFGVKQAVVLFQGILTPNVPTGEVEGAVVLPDIPAVQISGTNALQFNQSAGVGNFIGAVLKSSDGSAVNMPIEMTFPPDARILIPAGSYVVLQAFHSGLMMDFEVQATLFVQ